MYNAVETREKLVASIVHFEDEVKTVYSELVLPGWETRTHHFPQTLYGYMMVLFSRIDLLSSYWQGNEENQTVRMNGFMERYLSVNREANSVVVQMWRHKLMHTSEPRDLFSDSAGKPYKWLMHWWEHLPADQHYTITELPEYRVLNIGLIYLIADLRQAANAYISDMEQSPLLQANYEAVEEKLTTYKYKPY